MKKIYSKYSLKNIFSYLKKERTLEIIRYSKNIQQKLDLSKYDYIKLLIEKNFLFIYDEPSLYSYIGQNIKNTENIQKYIKILDQITNEYRPNYTFDLDSLLKNSLLIEQPTNLNKKDFNNIYYLDIEKLKDSSVGTYESKIFIFKKNKKCLIYI